MQERLRIRVDPLGGPTDGYGRTAEACGTAATVAGAHAAAIRRAAKAVRSGELELGRTGGNRLLRRLEVSAATFDRLAERDQFFAKGLVERERHWPRGARPHPRTRSAGTRGLAAE
jgi:hypothetical protein